MHLANCAEHNCFFPKCAGKDACLSNDIITRQKFRAAVRISAVELVICIKYEDTAVVRTRRVNQSIESIVSQGKCFTVSTYCSLCSKLFQCLLYFLSYIN